MKEPFKGAEKNNRANDVSLPESEKFSVAR